MDQFEFCEFRLEDASFEKKTGINVFDSEFNISLLNLNFIF